MICVLCYGECVSILKSRFGWYDGERKCYCETSRLLHFVENLLIEGCGIVSLTYRLPIRRRKISVIRLC
jgi:hypothetical protein